jgi:hypothetical protein
MAGGKIFISYRRDDSSGVAGRLYDRLAAHFGSENLFMDIDVIPLGANFVDFLSQQVAQTEAMLVLIGPRWIGSKDGAGRQRLANPDDFVRVEIEAALQRNIPVIPVLIDGAQMPRPDELPREMAGLSFRQATEVRHTHFGVDITTLISGIANFIEAPSASIQANNIAQQGKEGEVEHSLVDIFIDSRKKGVSLAEVLAEIEMHNATLLGQSNSMPDVEEHLKYFSTGRSRPLVFARLEYLFWGQVCRKEDPSGYADYLRRFPAGSHVEEARRKRDDLLAANGALGAGPKIFLNYRRSDSQDSADRIYSALAKWMPSRNILMDVDRKSIVPGLSVRKQLEDLVSSCQLMLVLVNTRWVGEFARRSQKHETDEELDYVRTEIVAALNKGDAMPIVPVILGETPTPIAKDLPLEIQALMKRSAHKISREKFDDDLHLLIQQTTRYLEGHSLL